MATYGDMANYLWVVREIITGGKRVIQKNAGLGHKASLLGGRRGGWLDWVQWAGVRKVKERAGITNHLDHIGPQSGLHRQGDKTQRSGQDNNPSGWR